MDMVLHAKQFLFGFCAYAGPSNYFTVAIEKGEEYGTEQNKLGTGSLGLHSNSLEARQPLLSSWFSPFHYGEFWIWPYHLFWRGLNMLCVSSREGHDIILINGTRNLDLIQRKANTWVSCTKKSLFSMWSKVETVTVHLIVSFKHKIQLCRTWQCVTQWQATFTIAVP